MYHKYSIRRNLISPVHNGTQVCWGVSFLQHYLPWIE